jgi:hypothetical protein
VSVRNVLLLAVVVLSVVAVIVMRRRGESWRTIGVNSSPGVGAILVNLPDSPRWSVVGWIGIVVFGLATVAMIISKRRR